MNGLRSKCSVRNTTEEDCLSAVASDVAPSSLMELPDRFNDCKAQEDRACEILDAPISVIAFELKSSLCRDFVPVCLLDCSSVMIHSCDF